MRRSSAALAALAALSFAGSAQAYCRTSSCPNVGTSQVCTPAMPGDCGVPLFWPKTCTEWSLQKAASAQVDFGTMRTILTNAFQTWMSAPCPGGGTPSIHVTEGDPVDCTKHEYNSNKANANVIVFREDTWPYSGAANTLALTTVTYALDSGEIYDADMELNSAQNHFTTGDSAVDFDLPSIITHEAGHFLGLAHTPDMTATMFPNYQPHTTDLRNLAADDIAGICAIYPPGNIDPACDPTPRHGFSTQCADEQTGTSGSGGSGGSSETIGGCHASAPQPGAAGAWALLGVALAAVAGRRRRTASPRPGC